MDSRRQNKVNKLLLKELSGFFQKNSHFAMGGLITVTDVTITADLGIARIHLSLLGGGNPEKIMEGIEDKTSFIRGEIGNALRNSLRKIPELHFYLDDSAEYAQNMNKVLGDLNIPPEEKNNDSQE